MKIPTLSKDLILQLDEVYPKLLVTPGMSMEDIMYKAGVRSVINKLLVLLREDEEGELTPKLKT